MQYIYNFCMTLAVLRAGAHMMKYNLWASFKVA